MRRSPSITRLFLAASGAALLASAALPAPALAFQSATSQAAAVAPSDPWAHTASDIPADPAVRFGLLPNGLRYALMKNATPPGQASLRVRIDAGSLMEGDDQLGLAHFMEHMAFNGSADIPEGELVKTLERLGLSFGADTNASTGFDETVYKLDLPRTDDETVDASLHILREMIGDALLAPEAIDRERGVVLSEERTRDGPGMRSARARLDFLMRGQRVPTRFPIGDPEILRTAPRDRFVAFYDAWYRPSRTTVVAVGDFDIDAMEAKIVAAFGDWSNPHADGAEPDLGAVQPRGPEAAVFVDPGVGSSLQIAWVAPPDLSPDTRAKQERDVIRSLGLQVLNRRFQSLARAENPPFVAASASRSTDLRSQDSASLYSSFTPGGWERALTTLDQEQRRLVQYGITAGELAREITEWRAMIQSAVAGAATRRTPALANSLAASVNSDDVFTAPAADLAIFDQITRDLTADRVNAALKSTFDGAGPLVFVTSPTAIAGEEAAVLDALIASQQVAVDAPAARAELAWPYADFGAPGAVVARSRADDVGADFITFANGTRLTVKPTTFRDDQIMVAVRAGDGQQGLPSDRPTPMWALGAAVAEGGLGQLTAEQVDEVLAGRVYGAGVSAGEDAYVLSGVTRPEDFAVQLQVLTAYLTDPAWRPEPFERMRGVYLQALPQMDATPGGVFGREIGALMRSGDARWRTPDAATLAAADPAALRAEVEQGIAHGPLEVLIVGDITTDEAVARVAATFGALPARPNTPVAEATPIRFPAPTAQPVRLTHSGRADQGLGYVAWPAVDAIADIREARLVRLLADVMRLRLTEELRENQAVTYSPSVGANASSTFTGYGYVAASIEAPPEKLPGFFADVDRIAAALAAGPITADELDRARRPRIEALRRSMSTNEFWIAELQRAQTDPNRLPQLRSALSDLEAAAPDDLQRVAAQYLLADKAYRVEVTPKT
ncbi:MAG: insulinase family protein [Brevundimonas sp.]|uniref:M16 family metallopeptidase n=1 Tax=Brevundimonas sp. TaxID=1871086 RepID=UPI0011F9F697|nr:insulinase family protein [Brevundimonas sp.]RZJ16529.1 MAG: insulinase family protein [Brevundimonas sp.]